MFKEKRNEKKFNWSMIGNVGEGRPNLGPAMDIVVYRLMQFTLRDVMITQYGVEATDHVFYQAGEEAGREFCKALVNKENDFNEFIKQVQQLLRDLKIGILRVEKADLENMKFVLTVAEDLDCSGLPICDETHLHL